MYVFLRPYSCDRNLATFLYDRNPFYIPDINPLIQPRVLKDFPGLDWILLTVPLFWRIPHKISY